MKVIQADHERHLVIPGVPGVAKRPVDIDQSVTGFEVLRTLRIYQFEAGAVVDGHAEEDEVYVIVLSGTINLEISEDGSEEGLRGYKLAEASAMDGDGCVAYLPPHSAYRLAPLTVTDVAYARATPLEHRAPAVFRASATAAEGGVSLVLDERVHASQLRLQMVQVHALEQEDTVPLRAVDDSMGEGLAHVRSKPVDRAAQLMMVGQNPVLLHSWDTVALAAEERPVLEVAKGAHVSVVTVFAK